MFGDYKLEFDSELAAVTAICPTVVDYEPNFVLITSLRTQAPHKDHFLRERSDFLNFDHLHDLANRSGSCTRSQKKPSCLRLPHSRRGRDDLPRPTH